MIKPGRPPILLEPVVAEIKLKRTGNPTVQVLDQSGRLSGRTVPVDHGMFTLDTGRDRSCWYLVTYP